MAVPFISSDGSTQIFAATEHEFRIIDASYANETNINNILNATANSPSLRITPQGIQVYGTLSATTVTSQNVDYQASNIILGGPTLEGIVSYSNNIGIGTTTPDYKLQVVAPFVSELVANPSLVDSFNPQGINGPLTSDIRLIDSSDDGNTLVASAAINEYNQSFLVIEKQNGQWNSTVINLPNKVQTANATYSWNRAGARAVISGDGTRIAAIHGFAGNQMIGRLDIYHKSSGNWVLHSSFENQGYFGWGLTISKNGMRVALTAPVLGTQNKSGNIYVYHYDTISDTWSEALSRNYSYFPDQVAFTRDGNTLALSCTNLPPNESSLDNDTTGNVYILTYSNGSWNAVQNDIVLQPPTGTKLWHYWGKEMTFSGNGNVLAVSAPGFRNNWSVSAVYTNAVYVYNKTNGVWSTTETLVQPDSYTPLPNATTTNCFGWAVELSSAGTEMAISAPYETVNSVTGVGIIYIFRKVNNQWVQFTTFVPVNGSETGVSLAVTTNMRLIIAGRNWDDSTSSITSYDLLALAGGYAIKCSGHMLTEGNITTSNITAYNTITAPNFIGNGSGLTNIPGIVWSETGSAIYTNTKSVGIGTSTPSSLLSVYQLPAYESITFTDFTTWTEYTNRISLTSGDDASQQVPNFGFDFNLLGTNVRGSTFVTTNSYITFGTGFSAYNIDITSLNVPAIYIGAGDNYMYDVSYTLGTYQSSPAMFLFWNGYDLDNSGFPYLWCAVFSSTNEVFIFMKNVRNDGNVMFGLGRGDGTWVFQLPENNTVPNVTNTAYILRPNNKVFSLSSTSLNVTNAITTGSLNVTNAITAGSLNVANGITAANMTVTGTLTANIANTITKAVTTNLSLTPLSWRQLVSISSGNGAFTVHLDVTQSEGGASLSKSYVISRNYHLSGGWHICNPISTSGAYEADDWRIEMYNDYGICIFRVVRVSGSANVNNISALFRVFGSTVNPPTITELSDTGTNATNIGIYKAAQITQVNGYVGIGVTNPTKKLEIGGDLKVNGEVLGGHSTYGIFMNGKTRVGAGSEVRYPIAGMTANTTTLSDGVYIASSSHTTFGEQPWALFDHNDNTLFTMGEGRYSGGYTANLTSTTFTDFSSNTVSLSGEWIQLQMPNPIKVYRYTFKPRVGLINRSPRVYVILGSNDGSSWYLVDDRRTNVVTYADASEKSITVSPEQTQAYSYYRIVINAVGGGEVYVNWHEWKLFSTADTQLYVDGKSLFKDDITVSKTFSVSLVNPITFTAQRINNSPSLTLDFTYPVLLQYYTLRGEPNSGFWAREPTNFDMQGSTDNVTFTTFDTRSNMNWADLSSQKFTPSPLTQSYRYYRMVPTQVYANDQDIIYPEISLYATNTRNDMMIQEGNVGIGTTVASTKLTVNGTIRNIGGPSPSSGTSLVITASGDIAPQSSDARYKNNIEDIPSVLDALMNLRTVSYQWKDEPEKWYGLLAQEVADVLPDAAWHDVEKDTYGVHYTPSIVTLLLKALQEMKQTYDQRISALEAVIPK